MAITLSSSPTATDPQSSGLPCLFRVTSDSTDVTTEIECKVYYKYNDGDFYKLAATKRRTKEVGYDYFEFDVSSVLDPLLISNISTESTGLRTNNSSLMFTLYFAEYYPSFTIHDVLTTSEWFMVKTKLYHTETQSIGTGSVWFMNGAGTSNFLTDNHDQYIRANEGIQLGLLVAHTDPVVRVREYKNDGSSANVTYELPDYVYSRYLWDWKIDSNKVVTLNTIFPSQTSTYSTGSSGTVGLEYMINANGNMVGGITLTSTNAIYDFIIPSVSGSYIVNIAHKSRTTNVNFEVYYKISGTWTLSSATMPQTASTSSFGLFTETPALTFTEIRIKKLSATGVLLIPHIILTYSNDNVAMKRCQFTLDRTHIDSDTKSLEIWAEQSTGGTTISRTATFTVDKTSTYQDTTRFAFLNKRGDFDRVTFTQMHSEILSSEKSKFTKELPKVFTTKDRGVDVSKVVSSKIFTCYSNYIEEADLQWYATLIESTEVYLCVGDTLIAIDILTDTVITYTHTDLVQIKIDWRYSVNR